MVKVRPPQGDLGGGVDLTEGKMMTRLLRAAILLALIFNAKGAFAGTTHYISKGLGSDTNNGTSKTTPWAHLPGMLNCTGSCASYIPGAGDQFILRGGDTWGASDLGDIWRWSGTSASPIYIGVDKTWFSGNQWTRPIFSCGGTACAGTANAANYVFIVGSYVTVDNIEFTGLFTDGSAGNPSYFVTQMQYDVVENCYFHGWTVQSGSTHDFGILVAFNNNNFSPYNSTGSGIFYSVIDGSDTAKNSMQAIGGNPTYIVGNVIQYVSNALNNIGATNIHDNYFGPVVVSFQAGAHQNVVALGSSDNGQTNQFLYNNVITGTGGAVCNPNCGGIVKLWLDQYNAPPSNIGYAFNNVIYNNSSGNVINQGHGTAGQTYWTWNFFNNTVECGADADTGPCVSAASAASTSIAAFNSINNHYISDVNPIVCAGGYSCPEITDKWQTVSAAKAQGYTSTSVFAFEPTSASGSTVNSGTNRLALCAVIKNLDAAAGAACQNDTGYSCSYSTSSHAVTCPERADAARPSTAAWDIGAFQYSSSQGQTVQPPTNLAAVVQ